VEGKSIIYATGGDLDEGLSKRELVRKKPTGKRTCIVVRIKCILKGMEMLSEKKS